MAQGAAGADDVGHVAGSGASSIPAHQDAGVEIDGPAVAEPRLVPEPRLRRGPGRKVVYPLARSGNLEYDRVLFFTDAVFAIAITLLVVDLRVPAEEVFVNSGHVLRENVSSIIGFAISFGVIGIFWVGHHSIFRYINALYRRLILLNLGIRHGAAARAGPADQRWSAPLPAAAHAAAAGRVRAVDPGRVSPAHRGDADVAADPAVRRDHRPERAVRAGRGAGAAGRLISWSAAGR